MKKIALVTYALNVGGMETFLFGLAKHLKMNGLEPTFVITDYIGPWNTKPSSDGFLVKNIVPSFWESKATHTRRVADYLKTFDIVLINHSVSAQSGSGLLPSSVVAISVLHNDSENIYTVGLSNLKNIDLAIAVSDRVKNQAIARGIDANQIKRIRNGVEIYREYPKAKYDFFDATLRIAFVGRVDHYQKGIFYLPGILQKLSEMGVDTCFDIVGDGPDLVALRDQIETLVSANTIHFHGSLPHEEAMKILQNADVLIMPSHFEGQPITLFETMARGVVPIVSLLNDITDTVIEDGKNGMLIDIGDEAGFANAISKLAINRQLLASMSKSAWQTATDTYGIETMVECYLNIIFELSDKISRPERSGKLDYSLLGRWPEMPTRIVESIVNIKKIIKSLLNKRRSKK
jgi:glycosyltransferase involved in cell wall biosynthesis